MSLITEIQSRDSFICKNFVRKPIYILGLITKPELYKSATYYPEQTRVKSIIRVYFEQIMQIIRYGHPEHFYFMYGLDRKYGKDFDSYVNYGPFMKRRNYLNYESHAKNNSCCLLRNKFYFGLFSDSIGINTPRNIFYLSGDKLYRINRLGGVTRIEFSNLQDSENIDLFCKIIDGECGHDVFQLSVKEHTLYYNNEIITPQELQSRLRGADFLFQQRIVQHPELSRINPTSINTIRLTTVRSLKTKEIKVWPSALRVGLNGNYVDNLSQGGLIIGIDLKTGKLNKYGFQRPEFGGRRDAHPDTGIVFDGFIIPFFKEAMEKALYFHSLLKDIHSIGWDIAITPDGPIFIEGNDNWEITISQAANRGLKKEFEEDFY